ncbi:MAG: hypothetical protein R3E13_00225 [Alphaproteobacteria bacterium]
MTSSIKGVDEALTSLACVNGSWHDKGTDFPNLLRSAFMKNRFKKQLLLLLPILLALFLAPALSAYAQIDLFQNQEEEEEEPPKINNPYDKKYKPQFETEEEGASLVPNYIYFFTFLRKPGASPDDLNLYILSPGSVFGCLDIENPVIEPVKAGPALRLKLTEGHIGADSETVRYFHHECKPGPGQSEVFITLSKKELMKDGIQKIVLVSETIGPFNDIILDFGEDRTMVTSKIQDLTLFGIPLKGQVTQFTYWNYPENTMILSSSSADLRDEKTRSAVKALVRRRGLTPLDEIIPDFQPHHIHADKFYAVDTSGRFKDKLEDPDTPFILGTVDVKELYFGANGPYEKAAPKTIFAKTPGLLE